MSDPALPGEPSPELERERERELELEREAPGRGGPVRAAASPVDADASEESSAEPTFLAKLRAAPVTVALIAMNAAAFAWAERHGGTTNEGTLLRFGAIEPVHFWAGEYWRAATYMFMHIGLLHIAMNMYVLIGWGSALERALGRSRFFLLYLLSGLGAGYASVIGGNLFEPHVSAGASGALFGIIGAVMALRRRQLPDFAAFFADRAIRSTLLQIGLWTVVGSYALHLDNSAHFGGFALGFVVCWIFTSPSPRNLWLVFGAGFGALLLLAARPWWSPSGARADDIALYANAYLTGRDPHGGSKAWPINVGRGERFAEKGCAHGVALACNVLADHVATMGAPDAAARSDALRTRTCELDPALCKQIH